MYELTQLMASLRRRRRQAIFMFLGILIVGSGAVLLFPRSYVVSSHVLIKRPDTLLQSTTYPQVDALLSSNRDTAIETYVAMALQPAISQHVMQELGLRMTLKKFLKWNLVVTPVTHSDIINIQVSLRDANLAAAAANGIANEFVSRQRALAASQAAEAADSLSIALQKARGELSSAESALELFETRHEIADAATQTTAILGAISDVESKQRAVEDERVQAQGQLSALTGQIAGAPAKIDATTVIGAAPSTDQLQQQLSQQRIQLAILRRQFTDQYPEVVSTESQIAGLEAALAKAPQTRVTQQNIEPNPLTSTLVSQAGTLKAQINGNVAQLNSLRSQELALKSQLRLFPADMAELATLQRREKSAETIFNALETNYFNAVVAKNMAVSDLSVVQEADPALAKVRPPLALSLIAIAVVALLGTVGIIALLDWYAKSSVALSEAR
jgi:succinoglycan biosynthesis transport protein ExoP